MKPSLNLVVLGLLCGAASGCHALHGGEEHPDEELRQRIVVTSPHVQDITLTQQYVCQIHSRRHIEVRALEEGYLEEILVKEGQTVTEGEVMFHVVPVLYKARVDAEKADAQVAAIEFQNAKNLRAGNQPVVSQSEVALYQAKLAKAEARVKLAEAELNFTLVRAPFAGIIDRQQQQQGSLVKKDEVLTTLSDNVVMWVYFNVPEARYFEYMKNSGTKDASRVELVLAGGSTYPQAGAISAIGAQFNNETGTVRFRADFPNPNRLLRHGQTGTILIHKPLPGALVIPQRATFELLDKRYVYVVDENQVARQRPITVQHELEDTFVIGTGLGPNDKIVLEGVREVHDGEKIDTEFRPPSEVLGRQKHHAE